MDERTDMRLLSEAVDESLIRLGWFHKEIDFTKRVDGALSRAIDALLELEVELEE